MVDIHCHILPGLDDGAIEIDASLEMAEVAVADGITHIVATPHANSRFAFDAKVNRRKRDDLQARVGSELTILLGCDFHIRLENLEAVRIRPDHYTINGEQYLLVEFANDQIPASIDKIFADLVDQRLVPVITHPERNPLLCDDYDSLRKWIAAGCLIQVTAGSFLGRFAKRAGKSARNLLEQKMIHFIATDAHNITSRPPQLSEARKVIAAEADETIASALCDGNPRAAIEGRELPWFAEPEPLRPRRWFEFHR